jgi:pimeloyl-ACP methyl ester carboxylesterase
MKNINFREAGSGDPVIILHGLFGSSDNWMSIGRKLAANYRVLLPDARNHGNSFHDPEFNYPAMADDLKKLMRDKNLKSAVMIGHSMGGKTAMQLAVEHPEMVEKLVVVDISPRPYPVHHQQILDAYNSIRLDGLQSRNEADQQMAMIIESPYIRQFLLKNLSRNESGSYEWKINLKIIEKNIEAVGMGISSEKPYKGPSLFIRGENSDYVHQYELPEIQKLFLNAALETIPDAGHWLHAEKPDLVLTILQDFLNS